MLRPYGAVGLVPTIRGAYSRADISRNLDHLEDLAHGALWLSALDVPVRLLVIPEGALQGFTDEALDMDPKEFAHEHAIEIPGPETDRLAALARSMDVYVMAQAKARHEDWDDLFFNVGIVIDPRGEIILKHYKMTALAACERSTSPHDLFDWWIEKYGRTLQAFWPTVDTEIGCLGVMMAMEGIFPENGRGLALNGAEVVYRASLPNPFVQRDVLEISSRARALENNFFVLSPNIGPIYMGADSTTPIDAGGGNSLFVDYMGRVIGRQRDSNGSTYIGATIDIEALRYHRESAKVTNWVKDIRTEAAQLIYENPIYPKNMYLDEVPGKHEWYQKQVIDEQVRKLQDSGIWRRSAYRG